MSRKELLYRYILLAPGLFILSFGIAFVTKAGLGTSPISSIPYSLSLIAPPFTMGNYTFAINALMVAGQWLMLRGKPGSVMGRGTAKAVTWPELLVQFFLAFALGYCIDISMWILGPFDPVSYPAKLASAAGGCCIMALGIYIQLIANVAMAPGDAFTRALTAISGKPFNLIRMGFDSSMVAIAALLCLIFLHELAGVREGTVICAFLTGNMVRVYKKILPFHVPQ